MISLQVVRRSFDSCGECDACCTVMAVAAIDKPSYVKCQHANGHGCDIYATKPHECTTWLCDWRKGYFGDRADLRPDRLGVVFSSNPNGTTYIYPTREENLPPTDKVVWLSRRAQTRSGNRNVLVYKYGMQGPCYAKAKVAFDPATGLAHAVGLAV